MENVEVIAKVQKKSHCYCHSLFFIVNFWYSVLVPSHSKCRPIPNVIYNIQMKKINNIRYHTYVFLIPYYIYIWIIDNVVMGMFSRQPKPESSDSHAQ